MRSLPLESKGFGGQAGSNAERRRQAKRTAEIYGRLVAEGNTAVAVVGDFNDIARFSAARPTAGQHRSAGRQHPPEVRRRSSLE